jgi:hypothetical protein
MGDLELVTVDEHEILCSKYIIKSNSLLELSIDNMYHRINEPILNSQIENLSDSLKSVDRLLKNNSDHSNFLKNKIRKLLSEKHKLKKHNDMLNIVLNKMHNSFDKKLKSLKKPKIEYVKSSSIEEVMVVCNIVEEEKILDRLKKKLKFLIQKKSSLTEQYHIIYPMWKKLYDNSNIAISSSDASNKHIYYSELKIINMNLNLVRKYINFIEKQISDQNKLISKLKEEEEDSVIINNEDDEDIYEINKDEKRIRI